MGRRRKKKKPVHMEPTGATEDDSSEPIPEAIAAPKARSPGGRALPLALLKSQKRSRSVFGSTGEDIWGKKDSRKRQKRAGRKKLPQHIRTLLGDATGHYIFKEYKEAKEACERVIQENPGISEPFHILGTLCFDPRVKMLSFFNISKKY